MGGLAGVRKQKQERLKTERQEKEAAEREAAEEMAGAKGTLTDWDRAMKAPRRRSVMERVQAYVSGEAGAGVNSKRRRSVVERVFNTRSGFKDPTAPSPKTV